VRYWLALIAAVLLIVALSWCAHAEEYMVASYGTAKHHVHHNRHHHSFRAEERQVMQNDRAALRHGRASDNPSDDTRPPSATGAVPLPRPNPLDASRPGMYAADFADLHVLMFGFPPLVHRGADW
jgi:hypothetical protein